MNLLFLMDYILWNKINPYIAKYVKDNFPYTLTYLEYPEEKRKEYSTTNYLEREFKEINRKIYDIGIFSNIYSAEKIIFLLILEKNLANYNEVPFYDSF